MFGACLLSSYVCRRFLYVSGVTVASWGHLFTAAPPQPWTEAGPVPVRARHVCTGRWLRERSHSGPQALGSPEPHLQWPVSFTDEVVRQLSLVDGPCQRRMSICYTLRGAFLWRWKNGPSTDGFVRFSKSARCISHECIADSTLYAWSQYSYGWLSVIPRSWRQWFTSNYPNIPSPGLKFIKKAR